MHLPTWLDNSASDVPDAICIITLHDGPIVRSRLDGGYEDATELMHVEVLS